MMWMSLSRTLNVPCAMAHLRERTVRRSPLVVKGAVGHMPLQRENVLP
jgi:hypothetical protein